MLSLCSGLLKTHGSDSLNIAVDLFKRLSSPSWLRATSQHCQVDGKPSLVVPKDAKRRLNGRNGVISCSIAACIEKGALRRSEWDSQLAWGPSFLALDQICVLLIVTGW